MIGQVARKTGNEDDRQQQQKCSQASQHDHNRLVGMLYAGHEAGDSNLEREGQQSGRQD